MPLDEDRPPDPTLRDIYAAREKIALARRTPLVASPALAERLGFGVYLKLENLQETGSFKLRGALNKLASLSDDERSRGVITASTGNHGRAVAFAARALGVRAVICLAHGVPHNKVRAIQELGAEIVTHGHSYDESVAHSLELQASQGLTYVHPFDDPAIIAGQGTLAIEMLEDLPQVAAVLVPLSGGGLISGVATALKAADPRLRVIGVSMRAAPVMARSLQAGMPIELPQEPTLADALVGGLGPENRYTFRITQRLVDDVALVSEEAIAEAMSFALRVHHIIVEGGGAVGIAAALDGAAPIPDGPLVIVVSGGNVDLDRLLQIVGGTAPPASTP